MLPRRLRKHVGLFPAQHENVMMAIKRASELSHSDKRGHNLDLICTDFLATNDFKLENDPEMQLRILAKFERLFQKKIMVVDPVNRRILYGMEALEMIATDEEVS